MRKIFLLLLILSAVSFFGYKALRESVRHDFLQTVPLPSSTPAPSVPVKKYKNVWDANITRSLFVPYWTLNSKKELATYDQYIYFGVAPGAIGIDKNEEGFRGIQKFRELVPKKAQKLLAVRMIDQNSNFAILKSASAQNAVIKDSISIARENGFSGVVLDLEVSAVPFDSLVTQINQFTESFYKEAKKENIQLTLMLYGDTFYRIRPFDVKALSKNADRFMIMSYDFSKSRGNPGPNFPLNGKEIYGYDMTKMADDFLVSLPPEKTTFVFGLYGYDWVVDGRGNAISHGEARTYQEIKKDFLGECSYKDCKVSRKSDSSETQVSYTDDADKKHVLWFEDTESAAQKQKYLQGRGVGSFSFWANSYF